MEYVCSMKLFLCSQLHRQMEDANFENSASVLSAEQIREIVRRRVSPLFKPV